MKDILDSIKLMNAKLDSILSLLDVLVRQSNLVNDEDDESLEAITTRSSQVDKSKF
ncbi:MAG: hypothetical protein SFU25_05745 [Candidatus Caenarcaniphilales bacterium]|nr:hypothetical protein [Candidatus Caenarcaniphilales bacterium]